MSKFIFELHIDEEYLIGDEFWEEAIDKDGTGIQDLTEAIKSAIQESNLLASNDGIDFRKVVKLKKYEI